MLTLILWTFPSNIAYPHGLRKIHSLISYLFQKKINCQLKYSIWFLKEEKSNIHLETVKNMIHINLGSAAILVITVFT